MISEQESRKHESALRWLFSFVAFVALLFFVAVALCMKAGAKTAKAQEPIATSASFTPTGDEVHEAETMDLKTEVKATIRLNNGSCSGTVIAASEEFSYILTARHCCPSTSRKVTVQYCDGSKVQGKSVYVSKEYDLCLIEAPTTNTLAMTPVSKESIGGPVTACGFTAGKGPKYKTLDYSTTQIIHEAGTGTRRWRWRFSVTGGPFQGGDSGGGVFQSGELIGVITHRDPKTGDLFAAPLEQVQCFIRNGRKYCRNYPQNQPNKWLQPNVPLDEILGPEPKPLQEYYTNPTEPELSSEQPIDRNLSTPSDAPVSPLLILVAISVVGFALITTQKQPSSPTQND